MNHTGSSAGVVRGVARQTTEVVATAFGNPDVLAVVLAERRPPAPNEVAIAVRAVGVNHRDYKSYADQAYATANGRKPVFPIALGVEASGIVIAAGAQAVSSAGPVIVGDEVIAYRIAGAYAEEIVVDAGNVVPKPLGLSWEQAAAMMLTATTAAHVLAIVRARPRQTVLVHGAGGGVGLAIAQLARLDGINIIGTASSKNFEALRSYGVNPIDYNQGLLERIRRSAPPEGIDAAIDLVGTDEAIDISLAEVDDRSRIVTVVAFERAKEIGIQAVGGSTGEDPTGIAIRNSARLRLTALVQAGRFDVKIARTFLLSQAAEAHWLLASGGAAGRIALRVACKLLH